MINAQHGQSILNQESSAWHQDFKTLVLLIFFIGNTVFSIGYSNFQTFDPNVPKPLNYGDFRYYLNLYNGLPQASAAPWRFLTPYMARMLPDFPSQFFFPGRPIDVTTQAAVKFGIINMIFLVGTCIVLYLIAREFRFTRHQGVVAAFVFLGLPRVVQVSTMPLANAGYWFFLSLAVLAIARGSYVLLFVSMLVGVWAKEEVALWAPLFVLLGPGTKMHRLRLFGCLVPGIICVSLIYLRLTPDHSAANGLFGLKAVIDRVAAGDGLRFPFTRSGLMQLAASYGLLWLPALYGLKQRSTPPVLRRWIWVMPLVILGTRLLGVTNISSYIMVGFPIVILLALAGLESLGAREFLESHSARTGFPKSKAGAQ
jgi:hypothetical protein